MNIKDKKTAYMIGGAVLIAIIAFYGGMQFGGSSSGGPRGGFQGQMSGGGGTGSRNFTRGANGGNIFGTVASKDATGITVNLVQNASTTGQGAGSKIILVDGSTQIGKFTIGSLNDLTVGQTVSIMGTPNTDGSITARMIQIRPAGAPGAPSRAGAPAPQGPDQQQ